MAPADDPDELLDVCDERGRPLGVKPRALVHRDGDWHRTVHIWVVLMGDTPRVVLQRRALTKDSYPGKVDVSVAGHLRAGETIEDGLREANEEIGLELAPTDVSHLGTRRHLGTGPGRLDREIQEVFLATSLRTFFSLRPDPYEVSSLLAVPIAAAVELTSGAKPEVMGEELTLEGGPAPVVLRRAELTADPDGYFTVALHAVMKRLADPFADDVTFDLGRS